MYTQLMCLRGSLGTFLCSSDERMVKAPDVGGMNNMSHMPV